MIIIKNQRLFGLSVLKSNRKPRVFYKSDFFGYQVIDHKKSLKEAEEVREYNDNINNKRINEAIARLFWMMGKEGFIRNGLPVVMPKEDCFQISVNGIKEEKP